MAEERIVYRVWFPVETEDGPSKNVSIEISAHPLRSLRTLKHQVWLLLSQKGYDLDPLEGGIDAIGTETVTQEEGN
ncbi:MULTISPECIES: hypothetical protein [unclassified Streptomyces]|uniref:hypothetical protein n=1 Tax=unclassified Streptomyces TaxID=2593676 RepID=UPI0035D7A0F3